MLATPLLDLLSVRAGTFSLAAAGILLTLAIMSGLLDLLGAAPPPNRQYFIGSHVGVALIISLIIGYAYSRWQGDPLPSPSALLPVDSLAAGLVLLQWWLGRKIVYPTALGSLFDRQIGNKKEE